MATINLVTQFSPAVDERFYEASKSSLVTNRDYEFTGAKTIKIFSVGTAEMNDYGRNTSGLSRYGTIEDLSNELQEVTMEKDRSFTFSVDKMDEDETLGAMNAGLALARQLNEVVIPEIDTYVYSKMVENAGNVVTENITDDNAYDSLTNARVVMDEALVPEPGKVCVATPKYIKNLKSDARAILDTEIGQDIKIKGAISDMDGVTIQKVTSKLLPSGVNYILAHPIATTVAIKLAEYKLHTDVVGISGSVAEGRFYYTAFVRNNKKDAIYVSQATSTETTDEETE